MKRKPYRLSTRATLDAAPPFTPELVRALLANALRGPKGRRATHPEPTAEAVTFLTATLNTRHAFFYAAQQERARKDRRDHAAKLIAELREVMTGVVKDIEEQKADDFFARKAERAAKAICALVTSDIPATALPPVELPDQVRSWTWCAEIPGTRCQTNNRCQRSGPVRFCRDTQAHRRSPQVLGRPNMAKAAKSRLSLKLCVSLKKLSVRWWRVERGILRPSRGRSCFAVSVWSQVYRFSMIGEASCPLRARRGQPVGAYLLLRSDGEDIAAEPTTANPVLLSMRQSPV